MNYFEIYYYSGTEIFRMYSEQPFPTINTGENVILNGEEFEVYRRVQGRSPATKEVTVYYHVKKAVE